MATWPATVPTTALAGTLNEELVDDIYSFQPPVGEPLTRNGSTVVQTLLKFETMPITSSQWTDLWTFYLANRALIFTSVHPDPAITGNKNFKFEAVPVRKDVVDGLYFSASLSLRWLP